MLLFSLGSQRNVCLCVMQLFFESQQEQVTKLLGKEGDLVTALMHNSGTWKLPVAVSAQIDTFLQLLLLMRMTLQKEQQH